MEERRLLLAVALSLLVLTAYQPAVPRRRPRRRGGRRQPPPPGSAPPRPAAAAAPAGPRRRPRRRRPGARRRRRPRAAGRGHRPRLAAWPSRNRGARLALLAARAVQGRARPARGDGARPRPGRSGPLDIETGDAALDARLRDALFRASAETLRSGAGHGGGSASAESRRRDARRRRRCAFEAQRLRWRRSACSVQRGGPPAPGRSSSGARGSATRRPRSARSRATSPPRRGPRSGRRSSASPRPDCRGAARGSTARALGRRREPVLHRALRAPGSGGGPSSRALRLAARRRRPAASRRRWPLELGRGGRARAPLRGAQGPPALCARPGHGLARGGARRGLDRPHRACR